MQEICILSVKGYRREPLKENHQAFQAMTSHGRHGSSQPCSTTDGYFELTIKPVFGQSMNVLRTIRVHNRETIDLERVVSVSQRCRLPVTLPRMAVQPPYGLKNNNGDGSMMLGMVDDEKAVDEDGNLILVLKKELSNSDVTPLGRIVLPKREAEAYLPSLTDKDGIKLEMHDMQSNTKWEFKYRFWPNNKSRMYILEHTGDFLKTYKLKTGDSFMIYKDMNDSKLMIAHKRSASTTDGEGKHGDRFTISESDDLVQPHQMEEPLGSPVQARSSMQTVISVQQDLHGEVGSSSLHFGLNFPH